MKAENLISQYKIVQVIAGRNSELPYKVDDLEGAINTLLAEGWQPHGSLSITYTGTNVHLAQAMVLRA